MQATNGSCADSERFKQAPHAAAERKYSSSFHSTWNLSQAENPRNSIASLRFPGRVDRLGNGPWIVFFLGLGNALERGLVGLLVHLRPVIFGFLFLAAMRPLALGVSGHREKRQNERRNRENLHRPCSLRHPWPTLQRDD